MPTTHARPRRRTPPRAPPAAARRRDRVSLRWRCHAALPLTDARAPGAALPLTHARATKRRGRPAQKAAPPTHVGGPTPVPPAVAHRGFVRHVALSSSPRRRPTSNGAKNLGFRPSTVRGGVAPTRTAPRRRTCVKSAGALFAAGRRALRRTPLADPDRLDAVLPHRLHADRVAVGGDGVAPLGQPPQLGEDEAAN